MILLMKQIERKNKMDNYFNEDNAVKFDLQNGKIETICFCRDKHLAKEIVLALNKYNDEDNAKSDFPDDE